MDWIALIELLQVLYSIAFCLVHAAFENETIFRVSQIEVFLTNGTDLSSGIPNVPSEVNCGYLCLHDDVCKAFFYDNSTLICKPEQQCRPTTSNLSKSEGVNYMYYTKEGECHEEEAFPTDEPETEINIMFQPIHIEHAQSTAHEICLIHGQSLIKVSSTSLLSQLITDVSMSEDAQPFYWTGHLFDTDGHLFCVDENTTGRCGLLRTCDTCQPCLMRASCEEEHPFICF